MMNKLTLCILILIAIVYIRFGLKVNPKFELIQTFLDSFHPSMLLELVPIIINEPIVDPSLLKSTIFAYSFIISRRAIIRPDLKYKNKCRYTIIFGEQSPTLVDIYHPFMSESISVKLKMNQVMIIPYRWLYKCSTTCTSISLMDFMSIISFLMI